VCDFRSSSEEVGRECDASEAPTAGVGVAIKIQGEKGTRRLMGDHGGGPFYNAGCWTLDSIVRRKPIRGKHVETGTIVPVGSSLALRLLGALRTSSWLLPSVKRG
jgi:hypothetical protein